MPPRQDEYNLDALLKFKARNKFSDKAWAERGLNPSNNEMSRYLNDLFTSCADEILEAIDQKASKKQLQKILKSNLLQLDKMDYDTEEREFICSLFDELSHAINVNFSDVLNKWLYGGVLTTLFKLRNLFNTDQAVFTLSQPCDSCGIDLETIILEERAENPETDWLVVKCNNCQHINLLSIGPGVQRLKFGNYQWIEYLKMARYTFEQANARVERMNSDKNKS